MLNLRRHFRPLLASLGLLAFLGGLTVTWQSALGEWAESRNAGSFLLRSEFALGDDAGQRLLGEMARLQKDVEQQLRLPGGSDPIEVNLFRTRSSYASYVRQRAPEGAERPALYVKGTDMGRVYVYRHWGFEEDVRHECTHAVLHNSLPYVPLWLDEGLAEYFEVPPGDRVSNNPHLNELKRRILVGWRPGLSELENLASLSDMGADHYRESWAWAHFLMHGPQDARQVLSDYLFDIHSGNLAGRLSDRLRARVPDADAQLVAHLRKWR
jgi:hypothetical protein